MGTKSEWFKDQRDLALQCNDRPICPACKCEQTDLFELDISWKDDGEADIECQRCRCEFRVVTHVTYAFSTYRPDAEAEARRKAEQVERNREFLAQMDAEADRVRCAFPIGARVRIVGRWASPMVGKVGRVANREQHGTDVVVSLDGEGTAIRRLSYDVLERID